MEVLMPTMNVNLTPEMAEFVAGELATGDYASASALVRDALRMLRRDRDIEREKAGILRREIDAAVAQAERREFSSRGVMEIAASVLHKAMEPKRRLIRALRDRDDDSPPSAEPSTRKAPENPSQAARTSTDRDAPARRRR
jgi:antitoxin ParD1/3/4